MQIRGTVSLGDNMHEVSDPIFNEKYFKMSAEIFTQHAKSKFSLKLPYLTWVYGPTCPSNSLNPD